MNAWIMEQLEQGTIDFAKLERLAMNGLMALFQQILADLLEGIDEILAATRDTKRYVLKERKVRTLQTLVGQVQLGRRYYWDREKQEWVYLLDERLGLEAYDQVSPGMVSLAVIWATKGPSYRDAQERLKDLYGSQVLSHEGIRRILCEVGEAKRQERENEATRSEGKRRVKALFIEVDGFYAYLQSRGKSRRRRTLHENKIAVVHEGWQARQGSGATGDYRLVNPMYVPVGSETGSFWETVRGAVAGRYDGIDEIPVIINGDGAEWIAAGAEHFRYGLYQYDRFHVVQELKDALRTHAGRYKQAREALERNDAQGVLNTLTTALREANDPADYEKIKELCRRFGTNPEVLRDYRVRLIEMGFDVDPGWRGMGAAESNVDKFKNRTGKHGRSWSIKGMTAMLVCMAELFEGTLAEEVSRRMGEREEWILDRIRSGAGHIARKITKDSGGVRTGGFPATQRGTEGYAKLFQALMQVDRIA